MIYDKIEHAARYIFELEALNKALKQVASGTKKSEDSEYYKNNLISFDTSELSTKKAEYHRKYIDIHVVLEGKEYVEVGHITELSECTPFDEQQDIGFGQLGAERKFEGFLTPGYFLVCFPEDAHLVGAHKDQPQLVQKIVYKVPVE